MGCDDINEKYLEYAENLNEIKDLEDKLYNLKRLSDVQKRELIKNDDGGIGLEISAHAFKQIAERLEALTKENVTIHADVFNGDSGSLLIPSNLKIFIITLLSAARKTGSFVPENSKSSRSGDNGIEYRYTVNIDKWSNDKQLQFICIVENNNIKTGYFNWV